MKLKLTKNQYHNLLEQNTSLDIPIVGKLDVSKIPFVGDMIAPKEFKKKFKKISQNTILEERYQLKIYRREENNIYPKEICVIFNGFLNVGVDYSTLPSGLLDRRTVVISEYNNKFEDVKSQLDLLTNDKTSTLYNQKIKITSIIGFSLGGRIPTKYINRGYFIGLIDPYLDKESLGRSLVSDLSNVRMMYGNDIFWKSLVQSHVFDNIKKLAKKMGDKSTFVDKFHTEIPKIFFEKYYKLM